MAKVARSAKKKGSEPGNFVSEWFGHRVYPSVVSSATSIQDQTNEKCPFLSAATGELRKCVKSEAAKGVCTISCNSNGLRQDWLVCPYRALSAELVSSSVRRLFQVPNESNPFIAPAATLKREDVRDDVQKRLGIGQPVFVYFNTKMGGELSIAPTKNSPEFSFDVTVVELVMKDGKPHVGHFGILEIQTMDFHGSYRAAVATCGRRHRLHASNFAKMLEEYPHWMSEGVEGPNIANVFKRTFYQMMFKFQLGKHGRSAGCVLAIPQAVWDSWQRHLGAPTLISEPDGTFSLRAPGKPVPTPWPAWIYVFEPDPSAAVTPSPLTVRKVIGTDAPAMSFWALEVAPGAALERSILKQAFSMAFPNG